VTANFGYDTFLDRDDSPPTMIRSLLACLLVTGLLSAEEAPEFDPLLAIPDEIVLESNFERPHYALPKSTWQARQGTRWKIAGGVLEGIPSSAEFQAKKSHHRGLEPRLSIPVTPAECVAQFSIRFLEGEETGIVPFVEFGHHIVRLRFSEDEGVSLLVDYESIKVAEDRDYRYRPGEWIHLRAALKGEEFVIQIFDGPTLHAKHAVLAQPAPSGGNGLGVAGTRGGRIEIDDLTLWTVKEETAPGWEEAKARFPSFEPVQVREKPKK
jgi:hypothetical protein